MTLAGTRGTSQPAPRQPTPRWSPFDVVAGLSVAGLILPEAVAYAGIAGLPAGRALAAGIAGGLVYVVIGRSRFAIVGPTSSSAAILAAAIAGLAGPQLAGAASPAGADPAQQGAIATALVAMVGVIFLGLSAFRMGSLASFISRPVLRGFAFGLAITISLRQLPKLLGVVIASGPAWSMAPAIAAALPRANPACLALGLGTLFAVIALRRLPRIPGALLVLAGGIALAFVADLPAHGIVLAGPVTLALPSLALPPMSLWPRLAQLAAPIALILFAESWGTMRSLALRHGDALDANRELGAIGLANLAAALAQGMPVGAGFSGGSANETAGASSRLSAATAALALAALAIGGGPLIARIPEPVLAAVVIAALTHALSPQPILHLFHIRRDHWIALAAAVGVLGLGVLNGMLAAIALSIANLLYDLAHPSVSALGQLGGQLGDGHDFVDIAHHPDATPPDGIAIYRPNAPLIFANAESVLRAIATQARASGAPAIILSLEESYDLDATAIEALGEWSGLLTGTPDPAEQAPSASQAPTDGPARRVILARAHDRVRDVLAKAGLHGLADTATYSVADAVNILSHNDILSHDTLHPIPPARIGGHGQAGDRRAGDYHAQRGEP